MVYAQGGAIASPSTADTDQPTAWMSSATACMQASGLRLMPSAIASHSAHRYRSSGGLARRLRGGFMPPRYEGGTTFSAARAGRPARRPPDRVPRMKWLAECSAEALRAVAPELSGYPVTVPGPAGKQDPLWPSGSARYIRYVLTSS